MLFSRATKELLWAWNKDIAEDATIIGGLLLWIFNFTGFIIIFFFLLLLLYGVCYLITKGVIAAFGDLFPIRISINCPCHAKDSPQSGGKIGSDR